MHSLPNYLTHGATLRARELRYYNIIFWRLEYISRDNDITIGLAANRISALTTICFTKRLVFSDKDDKP